MLNNFAENGGFNNNHGQAARSTEAQKPQNIASTWGYNSQLEGMYYGGEHQPMYMGTYGSSAKHPNYPQYPTSSIHQPVPTPVVKCMEACCQHYPINPAPLRYHQTNTVHGDTRQYRSMQSSIPRKKVYPTENTYPGISERHYPQYIGRGPALNVTDSRQQMPVIRPQYPMYPGYWENRSWVGTRMNCPPSYHQSVNQSAQLQTGLKIPDGSHYMDPNAQKIPSSQHRRVSSGSGGTEIIRPIPEPKRQILDHNPQSCYEYGYPAGFLPFNDVNKIQNGSLACQNNNPSYKIPSDKQYHPHQMQYSIQHTSERNLMNPNGMYDLNYPMNYPLPSSNDPHLRPEAEENQHISDSRKYDSSLTKNIDLRQYLATWDDDEDEGTRTEPSTNNVAPYVVVDSRCLETDASGKLQEQLNLKPQESPAKGKDNSPTCAQSAEEQPLQNNDAGRSEVHQTGYAPSMPTLLSDLDKNTTPWNGISREEGVIGKGGAFQPLDCSKRDMTFDNQKRDSQNEHPLHKLPTHTNDPTNLSFDPLASYYNETRKSDTYNPAELGNRIVKSSDTTMSNYHHVQPLTNVSRPCDPRLQQSHGNNSSIYSKVAPKYPNTNSYDQLKSNPTDGYYNNYKHSIPANKYFGYATPVESNYDYHKYISDLDSGRLFENKEIPKDPRRMYHQEMGKGMSEPFMETYNKTSDSNLVSENSNYGLNTARPEPFIGPTANTNKSNHQLSPFQGKTNSPGDIINMSRNETQSYKEKTVLVTSQSGSAELFTMPYSPEKDTSHKDNVVTLHSADQAKDNTITLEVPYVQQYSTLVRLSEEISQTEPTDLESGSTKSVDPNNKPIPSEELKKPTSLKIKRLPNSEEWAVEENSSNQAASNKSTNTLDCKSNESLEKGDMLKMSVNVGSLNMPSLDDIRDGEEGGETLVENLTNKFTEGTISSTKTSDLEDLVKTKPSVQVPQMAIVQPMKLLEPEPECLDATPNRKHEDRKEKELSFNRSYSNPYDLNQNNFSDKLLLNDIHHGKQPTFSKHEVSKHENFRTHKKIQRSHSDYYSNCSTDQRDGFIPSEDKIPIQSYSDCDVSTNLRGYFKIGEDNVTEAKCLNSRIPSSPGVDGMFEDINHSDKNLLYQRKSCDYQETNCHEMASLDNGNHFQSFTNMFIDDMNKRERSDGSVLQMSDKKCLKSQSEHQDLSKSFEEHQKEFISHSENRITTSEKLALSKKSPPIPPINLKLIESKKIWCITNKEQHLNQSNCLYDNSFENVSMSLDCNHIEAEPLEDNAKIIEKQHESVLMEVVEKECSISIKTSEGSIIDKHLMENTLNAQKDKRSSVTKPLLETETPEVSNLSVEFKETCHEPNQHFNSSSSQGVNKCLSIVKYYPPIQLMGGNLFSTKQDACSKIFIFDEKGNHFPEATDKLQDQRTESEAVVFDILNDILTKSVSNSKIKASLISSSNVCFDLSLNSNKLENHTESVIKFDTSNYNKKTEKLTDPIAKTTEKFIQHEKENCQHYSVIKVTQLEVANLVDLQKSSIRSIFSPMPDDDKVREEYPNQFRPSQNIKVNDFQSHVNEVTQMEVDDSEDNEDSSNGRKVEMSSTQFSQNNLLENESDSNRNANNVANVISTTDRSNSVNLDDNISNREPLHSPIQFHHLTPLNNSDKLDLNENRNNHSESLVSLQQEEINRDSDQSILISSDLKPTSPLVDDADRSIAVVNQPNKVQIERGDPSDSKSVFKDLPSELELTQSGNPLDNDLALSPESSSSESMESDFSDDYESLKDDQKHQTDCSSVEDEIVESDDISGDNSCNHSNKKLRNDDQLPLPTCQIDAPHKQDLVYLEDRSQTSVIVINKTCNKVRLYSDQDYSPCFDCNDTAMPIDCSMKTIGGKDYQQNSTIRTEKLHRQNNIYNNNCLSNCKLENSEMNGPKNYQNFENPGTESNWECEDMEMSRENFDLNLGSGNSSEVTLNYTDSKTKEFVGEIECLSKEVDHQLQNENSILYCTNEGFLYSLEEIIELANDHPSYMHQFKKRKLQKFLKNELDIILDKLNVSPLERNFSIINFGPNSTYPMNDCSLVVKPIESPEQNTNDEVPLCSSSLNLAVTINHFSTNSSSVATIESLENEKKSMKNEDTVRSDLEKEIDLSSSDVREDNSSRMMESTSDSENSSDTEDESCLPPDSMQSSLTCVQINSANSLASKTVLGEIHLSHSDENTDNRETKVAFQEELSPCGSDSQSFDDDPLEQMNTTLPVEVNNTSESAMSEDFVSSKLYLLNSQSKTNDDTEMLTIPVTNLVDDSTEVQEHKNENIKDKDEITECKNENASLPLFSSCSIYVNEKDIEHSDENSKPILENQSTNNSLDSWNDSDSSVSCTDSQNDKISVGYDLPKTSQPSIEATVEKGFIQPTIHNSEDNIKSLTETNSDTILTPTSNETNSELLNDGFTEMSDVNSSSEICEEPNVEEHTVSEEIASSIVTGEDVLFSSRFLQEEEETFSNSELDPTSKDRKGLPEEEDDFDHDVRTDAVKESLRNNQILTTETFPLQCLVEAALALENVDSKQLLLNNNPLLDSYCQPGDRSLKLPEAEILPNCFDEPSEEDKAAPSEHSLPKVQTENTLSLADKEVFAKFVSEETNYNLRASTRIVTSSSSNIIPYSKRKYCFKSKLIKNNTETKQKSQIKEKNRPKKRKGFFSYPRSKRRKRMTKDKQQSIPVPLQEIFDDNLLEVHTVKEIAREVSQETLEPKESFSDQDDQNIKNHSESDVDDKAVNYNVENPPPSPYFSKNDSTNDFGGPLIIASNGNTQDEANILCVQVNPQKTDTLSHNLNEELESMTDSQSFFKEGKTLIESELSNVALGNSTSLVIIIEDLDNIEGNKSSFDKQRKRDSDFIFGSVEDCTISKNNTDDCSAMLTSALSINESCICPPHYSLDGICENGLHKEKSNELLESEHFIANAFINIEDTSYRKYSGCSNSELLATNCYEEINENDISNWPFVEEEVAEFETNPDSSNTIPENGRKIELKCSLPWKKIFNISKTKKRKNKTSKSLAGLELGPANVEVRLKAPSSEWKVIGDFPETSSPVVKVSRLILQRESETSSYSEKDSEEESENKTQQNSFFSLQDENECNIDHTLVKDVINDEQWQPVVLLTRSKLLDELNLSIDSKSSGKEMFSPQNMSPNDCENFEDRLKELQNTLKEVQHLSTVMTDETPNFNSDDAGVKTSQENSTDSNDCQSKKVKLSSYGTYSPSADNNTSINDIPYSPSDPHFSPEQGFYHSNESSLSKKSVTDNKSSYIDDVFEESYENTRLTSYFTDACEKSYQEVRGNEESNMDKRSFLNETVDDARSAFLKKSTQETSQEAQKFFSDDLSAKSDLKENHNSYNEQIKISSLNTPRLVETKLVTNEPKDATSSRKTPCDSSTKIRRKMPKNFFVRRKVRKNRDLENIDGRFVSRPDSLEATMWRKSTSCSSDSVLNELTAKTKVDEGLCPLASESIGTAAELSVVTDNHQPTNKPSPECENSRLQCIYDLDESSPVSQHEFPPSERFEENQRLREGGRGLKRPCEGHSKEDTKRRRKSSRSRSSCSECELQFDNKVFGFFIIE